MKKTFVAIALLLCMNVFAHSNDNFVESDLFGNLGARDKAAILIVHFGTSHNDTRALTIDALNTAMREAFPGIEIREAWTSRIIIRKLAPANLPGKAALKNKIPPKPSSASTRKATPTSWCNPPTSSRGQK